MPSPLQTSTSMTHCGRRAPADPAASGPGRRAPRPPERRTYVVPPALAEVGQLVLQAVLQELEHHAHHRARPPVADHQRLRPGRRGCCGSALPPAARRPAARSRVQCPRACQVGPTLMSRVGMGTEALRGLCPCSHRPPPRQGRPQVGLVPGAPRRLYEASGQLAHLALWPPGPCPPHSGHPECPPTTRSGRRRQGGAESQGTPPNNAVTLPSGTSRGSVQAQSRPAYPAEGGTQASHSPRTPSS